MSTSAKAKGMEMSDLRPGGFRITKEAMDAWKLPKGAKVLDIGCGTGETLEFLEKEYGFQCSGIDLSMAMVKAGKARNPSLDIKYGDGEFLDGFSSFTFDGVLMECALSLIGLPGEALHEAFCVLKKGGRLFVSDLYVKNPDPAFLTALRIEAERQERIPHKEGDCNTHCADERRSRPVSFRADGRFLKAPLIELLEETGYQNITWQDRSAELDRFAAETIPRDSAPRPEDKYKTGYFMLTAEKPPFPVTGHSR
jgi:SAM-dependent methyltransferase